MSITNNIISAPVSIEDVQHALGETSGDLYTLCRSDKIKRLSPYKPIRGNLNNQTDKVGVLSDSDIIDRNMGFDIPTFPWTGITFEQIIRGIVTNSNTWGTVPSSTDQNTRGSIGNGWVYNKPIEQTHYARLTDFNHYDGNNGNSYETTTFEVLEGTKSIIAGQTYTGKFFVKMSPYHPKNFKSALQYAVGVAIVRASFTGTTYYYIGGETGTGYSSITQNAMGVSECDLIIPDALFTKLLNYFTGTSDISIYAVGFLAPLSFAGYQNIDSQANKYHAANDINTLIPLPGLGYDNMTWHPASRLCYLDFNGNGTVIEPGTTATTLQLLSVVNNYTTAVTSFTLYSSLVKYTYQIYNGTSVVYSMSTRASFPSGTTVDVSNTQVDQATRFNLIGEFPTQTMNIPQTYSNDGYRVQVTIWYLDGVNPVTETGHDYCQAGSFWIKIGTPSPDD